LRWNGDKETSDYVRVDLFGRANLNKHFTVYGRIENLFDQEATEEIGYEQPGIYAIAGLEWKL
jgi:outer membrane cobalamin receptor